MIIDFKIFESQETILNDLLDKIQQFGKESLSPNEMNFLNDYPNTELIDEEDDISYIPEVEKSSYSTENFQFELSNTDIDELTNTFIVSGEMLFIYDDKKNIAVNGYFVVNMETYQSFPYFTGLNGETAYDYASGHEEEFTDLLEEIYEKNKKE